MRQGASAVVLQRAEIGVGVANIARSIQEAAGPGGRVSAGSVVTHVMAVARHRATRVYKIDPRRAGLKDCAAKKKNRGRAGIGDTAAGRAVVPGEGGAVHLAISRVVQTAAGRRCAVSANGRVLDRQVSRVCVADRAAPAVRRVAVERGAEHYRVRVVVDGGPDRGVVVMNLAVEQREVAFIGDRAAL